MSFKQLTNEGEYLCDVDAVVHVEGLSVVDAALSRQTFGPGEAVSASSR